jgi:hypothetical protein
VVKDVAVDVRDADLVIPARLQNDTDRDTTEVVQAYFGARGSQLARPTWRLGAFARTAVSAKSSASVRLSIPFARMAVRVDGSWKLEPGPYEIAVGRHAHDPEAVIRSVELRGVPLVAH